MGGDSCDKTYSLAEYELSLLRQRGLAALQRIEMDPDQRVVDAIRLVFKKFRELGSACQVLLWAVDKRVQLPVMRQAWSAADVMDT